MIPAMKNSPLSALFFAASLLTPLPGQQRVDGLPKPCAPQPAASTTTTVNSAVATPAPKNTPPTSASPRPSRRELSAHLFM
jgi:hypothetical protein